MLARLQQLTTLALLAAALAWAVWLWPSRPVLALLGAGLILLGHALILAAEFVLVWRVNRADPLGAPPFGQLVRAWLAESLMAPRVFCWRQPFRSRVVPDQLDAACCRPGAVGVVLIHGFVCNRGFWTPWLRALRANGHAFVAVNLEPVFGSIDAYAPIIEQAVQRVAVLTGRPPVLVAHSMGGLAARAWLRSTGGTDRVAHVITIGTPHRGTWLGRFSHVVNGRQMRLGGDWVTDLGQRVAPDTHAGFTCWYSNCDNIVFPASTATLPGADNRLLYGAAHVELAFRTEVMGASLAKIASL